MTNKNTTKTSPAPRRLATAAVDGSAPSLSGRGRRRGADGLTAAQRATRDVDAHLAGRTCSVCGAPATTFAAPSGGISAGRLRQGEHPGRRPEILASVTDFRCHEHRPIGRPRNSDGTSYLDRANADCDAALADMTCALCSAPAVTARTPAGAPSMAALRHGDSPENRHLHLANLTDPRCADHPLGQPRIHGHQTSVEHAQELIDSSLAAHTCADPSCTETPTGGITPPGLPNLGQLRGGDSPTLAQAALEAATVYCTPHLAARTGNGIDPTDGLNPRLARRGGPFQMVHDLIAASDVHELAGTPAALEETYSDYELIGIDLDRVYAHRAAYRRAAALAAFRRAERGTRRAFCDKSCPLNRAWVETRRRVTYLGDVEQMLPALAAAATTRDLARRLRGKDNGGVTKTVVRGFGALGVDLADYWPHRLRAY